MRLATVALVGGDSLLAKDVSELLSQKVPDMEVIQADVEGDGTILTEQAGEPTIVSALDEDLLQAAQVVILAGTPASSRSAFELLSGRRKALALIDLTYALEDEADAHLQAPLAEPPNQPAMTGPLHIIAHPAASVLAAFIQRLHKHNHCSPLGRPDIYTG